MRVRRWCLALVLLALASAAPREGLGEPPAGEPAPADPREDAEASYLQERIGNAIERGVAWLRKRQRVDGSWFETHTSKTQTYGGFRQGYWYPAGASSLAVYTLLKCEVARDDAAVRRAFDWLRKTHRKPKTSYEVATLLLAITARSDPHKKLTAGQAAGPKERLEGDWKKWATELRDALTAQQAPDGWRYYGKGGGIRGGDQDISATQIVVFGLFAAEQVGISVPTDVWIRATRFAMAQQDPEGPERARAARPKGPGWDLPRTRDRPTTPSADPSIRDRARGFAYIRGPRPDLEAHETSATGSRTACGVGALAMARYVFGRRTDAAAKAVDLPAIETSIYDGVAWIDANWSPFKNPPRGGQDVYYLYSVERAMDMLGSWRIGARSWYVEMTEQLLGRQHDDGHWNERAWSHDRETFDTCFALLFLSRATRGALPVVTQTGN